MLYRHTNLAIKTSRSESSSVGMEFGTEDLPTMSGYQHDRGLHGRCSGYTLKETKVSDCGRRPTSLMYREDQLSLDVAVDILVWDDLATGSFGERRGEGSRITRTLELSHSIQKMDSAQVSARRATKQFLEWLGVGGCRRTICRIEVEGDSNNGLTCRNKRDPQGTDADKGTSFP